jgi:N-acetylmuramoyl-L-alanine amidase
MKNIKIVKSLLICLMALLVGLTILWVSRARPRDIKVDTKVSAVTSAVTKQVTPSVAAVAITTSTPTPTPVIDAFEEIDDNIFINADDVNLRAEPSVESEIIAAAPKSSLYRRIGFTEEWSRILYHNQVCYVSNDLITTQVSEEAVSGIDDPEAAGEVKDKIVIIDPGHQGKGDSTKEPIGPGTSVTKARVTSGTTGRVSGWAEYELNLAVSLQLRDELVKRGYTVYMTRETHDINISNRERAEFAANHNGDILVRIHANGSDNTAVNGALCMAPTNSNSFLSGDLISESQRLSQCIIDKYVAATGFNNQGVYLTDEMSGINWSTIPVTIVEMGYMSNASDDAKMADPVVQIDMVRGMCDGIDSYFTVNAAG